MKLPSSMSNQKSWPEIRSALEQKMEDIVRAFIATDTFDAKSLRILASELMPLENQLSYMDSKEKKMREILSSHK